MARINVRWTPEEDEQALAAAPLPVNGRKSKRGEPKPVSELEAVAVRLGRSNVAVRCRRSRLLLGKVKSR